MVSTACEKLPNAVSRQQFDATDGICPSLLLLCILRAFVPFAERREWGLTG